MAKKNNTITNEAFLNALADQIDKSNPKTAAKDQLSALLNTPVFKHERSQWLAEIEYLAPIAEITVHIHEVNLPDNTDHIAQIVRPE